MTPEEHRDFLRPVVASSDLIWADLGSGEGAFTQALASLLAAHGTIYSVDKDSSRLSVQQDEMRRHFPTLRVKFLPVDFTGELTLPPLDGILMANSLHYVQQQVNFLAKLSTYLKEDGKLVVIEYDTETGNQWVPYPVPFAKFKEIAGSSGYTQITKIHSKPSSFLREMYSAVACKSK